MSKIPLNIASRPVTLVSKAPLIAGRFPGPTGFRPTHEDWELFLKLRKKLGVEFSQVLRLGLRALAAKEGVKL
jgi:hypothetical protein